jgi:hypothetical protein
MLSWIAKVFGILFGICSLSLIVLVMLVPIGMLISAIKSMF